MASPSLTAIVCAYWPERFKNVERIIQDLQESNRPPDTLIVLNNNPQFPGYFSEVGYKVIKGTNWECRGKYVAALLAFADYYLLCDDDITVGKNTTRALMERAYPGCITANRGIVLAGDSFYEGEVIDADKVSAPYSVGGFCGSCVFASHDALVKTLATETQLRKTWPVEGDDILAGLANRGESQIWPMHGDDAWVNLHHEGVAMNIAPGYYEMRDRFTYDALNILGRS